VRAVIDTNVLLSGLLWHGAPHTLLDAVRERLLGMVSSPALLAEFEHVISRPKFDAILIRSQTSREQSIAQLRLLAEIMDPPALPKPVCRDPDDDAMLALAVAAQVDFIISGDDDLLTLEHYEGILIISPSKAIELIKVNQQRE
jgi:putative PIN family toxin of toxin-antitoxin system